MSSSLIPSPQQCTLYWGRIYRQGFVHFCRILKRIGLYDRLELHVFVLSLVTYGIISFFLKEPNWVKVENYKLLWVLPFALLWQSFLNWRSERWARILGFGLSIPLFIAWTWDTNHLYPGMAFDIAALLLAFFIFRRSANWSFKKRLFVFSLFILSYSVFSYYFQVYFVVSPFLNFRPLMFLSLLPSLCAQSEEKTLFATVHFSNLINTSPSRKMKISQAQNLNAHRGLYLYYFVLLHAGIYISIEPVLHSFLPKPFYFYSYLYVISYCAGNIPIVFFRLNGFRALDAFELPLFASSLQSHWSRWNRNFYDWMLAYIYFPVFKLIKSQFSAVMLVFVFTFLIHTTGALTNLVLSTNPFLSGFIHQTNQFTFFMLNGLFVFFNLKIGSWKAFDESLSSGWIGTILIHSFYLSICNLVF